MNTPQLAAAYETAKVRAGSAFEEATRATAHAAQLRDEKRDFGRMLCNVPYTPERIAEFERMQVEYEAAAKDAERLVEYANEMTRQAEAAAAALDEAQAQELDAFHLRFNVYPELM